MNRLLVALLFNVIVATITLTAMLAVSNVALLAGAKFGALGILAVVTLTAGLLCTIVQTLFNQSK